MRFDFGQSYGAVALYAPRTGNFTTTVSVLPPRQRISDKAPRLPSSSASVSALPISVRGSYENSLPPTPRITSPTARTPSAGEFLSTFVIRICRASAVTSLSLYIHPRAPVAPSVQSWFAPSGITSPLVKSGIAIVFAALTSGPDKMRSAASAREVIPENGWMRALMMVSLLVTGFPKWIPGHDCGEPFRRDFLDSRRPTTVIGLFGDATPQPRGRQAPLLLDGISIGSFPGHDVAQIGFRKGVHRQPASS